MPRRRRILAVFIATCLATTSFQAAQAQKAESLAEARAFVIKGNARFQVGRFQEALEFYEKAYDLRPTPNTLFNIAQCYRQLKNHGKAIFAFRQYLAQAPGAPNRADVEAIIAELEVIERRESESQRRPPGSVKTPEAAPRLLPTAESQQSTSLTATERTGETSGTRWYKRWYVWAIVGVVVAGGVVAGAVAGSRGKAASAPDSDLGLRTFNFGGR